MAHSLTLRRFAARRLHCCNSQRAFTLVEIMVVLIILVILMTVFGGKVFGAGDRAKAKMTTIKMTDIQNSIEQFRLQYNKVPSRLESLVTCSDETGSSCTPIANPDSLLDAWNNPFLYAASGDGRAYTIKSLGADGKDGGDGVNGDLTKQGP